jgi:hypothetical protein
MLVLWAALEATAVDLATLQAELAAASPHRGLRIAARPPQLPAEAYAVAASGQVATGLEEVAGHRAKQVWGVTVVDVPIDRMWAAVNDDRSKVEFTALGYLELISGEFCSAHRRVFQYLDVSLASDRWWVVDQRMNTSLAAASGGKVREVIWTSVPGEVPLQGEAAERAAQAVRVTETAGAWLLVALPGGSTLVEYHALSDPGGAVPAGLASRFAAGSLEDTFQQMANLARKGPTCLGG